MLPICLLPLVACATSVSPTSEDVGATTQAIVNGSNDDAGLDGNIVVALELPNATQAACTGTLLTPTLVLTSRTCVGTGRAGSRPVVRVGATRATSRTYQAVRDSVVMGAHNANDPAGADPRGELALVFLDPQNPVVDNVQIPHQELAELPEREPDANGARAYALSVAGFAPTGAGSAASRQRYDYDVMSLMTHWLADDDQPFWVRDASDDKGRLVDGDLGGPLYRKAADGSRQLVGVAALFNAHADSVSTCPPGATSCDVWNDVTFDPSREWIWRNARMVKTDANARWFDTHPSTHRRADGTSDWWSGEVDYTGACRAAVDSDCDHWFDKNTDGTSRDNCPGKANVDQADRDDDGVGDACDACPAIPQNMCEAQNSIGTELQAAKVLGGQIDSLRQVTRCGPEGLATVREIDAKMALLDAAHTRAVAALATLRGAGGSTPEALAAVEAGEAALLDLDTTRFAAGIAARDARTEASLPYVASYVSKADVSCVTATAQPTYKYAQDQACGAETHWAVDESCGHDTYPREDLLCPGDAGPSCDRGDTEVSRTSLTTRTKCGAPRGEVREEQIKLTLTCRRAAQRACNVFDRWKSCRLPSHGVEYYPTCTKPEFGIASYLACHTASSPTVNSGGATMRKWSNAFGADGGFASFNETPRALGDVNGDGKLDIVGFGAKSVRVALSTGKRFAADTEWTSLFATPSGGYTSFESFPRMLADVNGDKTADIVAFGNDGLYVALSTGTSFAPATRWTTDYGYVNAHLASGAYPLFVGDLNGDGKADVMQAGELGVWASLSTGTGFTAPTQWTGELGRSTGWTSPSTTPIFVADVNGDGKADMIGIRSDGEYVALSNGTSFAPLTRWGYQFAPQDGWADMDSRTRFVGDVNGDGKADMVGFGGGEVWVSLSTGTSFDWARRWVVGMGPLQGFSSFRAQPRLGGDVDGDGKADLVGFAADGTYVSRALSLSFGL